LTDPEILVHIRGLFVESKYQYWAVIAGPWDVQTVTGKLSIVTLATQEVNTGTEKIGEVIVWCRQGVGVIRLEIGEEKV
jgi:hypothetical protein